MKASILIGVMTQPQYAEMTCKEFANIYNAHIQRKTEEFVQSEMDEEERMRAQDIKEEQERYADYSDQDEAYEDSSQADMDYECYKEDKRGCND